MRVQLLQITRGVLVCRDSWPGSSRTVTVANLSKLLNVLLVSPKKIVMMSSFQHRNNLNSKSPINTHFKNNQIHQNILSNMVGCVACGEQKWSISAQVASSTKQDPNA